MSDINMRSEAHNNVVTEMVLRPIDPATGILRKDVILVGGVTTDTNEMGGC